LSVCRRYKGRVHPGVGYLADIPRDSGLGKPGATSGPG
jgi:hypothetical protein